MDTNSTIFLTGLLCCCIAAVPIYFAPALVAWCRHHHNTLAIFVLNLLLGWIVLGWIVALVWSCTATANGRPTRKREPVGRPHYNPFD